MNILVIGGSNSIISDGYLMHLKDSLQEKGYGVTISNVAVGGTTSLSCIGLLDKLRDLKFDIIIFEYSLNDTGHLNHRKKGKLEKQLMLEIVFSYLTVHFSDAIVVPLILASEPFYKISTANIVYDAELEFYNELNLEYLDMRREFYRMFGEVAPDFLYSDIAHFHRGFASAVIGRLLAQTIRIATAKQNSIGKIGKPYVYYNGSRKMAVKYVGAEGLAELNRTAAEISEISNRHLHIKFLELSAGQSLRTTNNILPICIYIVSDRNHSELSITSDTKTMRVSTQYTEIKEGKFLFTSIPLILLEDFDFDVEEKYTITLETEESKRHPLSIFDCFDEKAFHDGSYANIVGILSLQET